jgi:hypothetical protein
MPAISAPAATSAASSSSARLPQADLVVDEPGLAVGVVDHVHLDLVAGVGVSHGGLAVCGRDPEVRGIDATRDDDETVGDVLPFLSVGAEGLERVGALNVD